MPAGTYAINNEMGTNFVVVRNVQTGSSVTALGRQESPSKKTNVLIFHRYGSQYSLTTILGSQGSQGMSFPAPKQQKQLEEASVPANERRHRRDRGQLIIFCRTETKQPQAASSSRCLLRKLLTDKNGPFQRIEYFQDLQPQVGIDLLAVQPPLHHGLRLRAILALDERSKPRTEKEDLAMLLDVG